MARATRAANRSLFRLKDRGWVRIEPVFTMARQFKRLTAIELNVLTASGIETVRRLYASDPQTWGLAPSTNAAIEFVPELIKHEVAVRDALIGLLRMFDIHRIPVAWWTLESRAWIASGGTSLIQAPDLILTAGEDRVPLLVEVDMGTESIDSDSSNSWRVKIARYENYLRDLAGNDPLFEGCQMPQVLVIAPAGERLRNLHRAIEQWGSPGHWWLTTLIQLEAAEYVPPGEVFLRSGMTGEQSLAEWICPSSRL